MKVAVIGSGVSGLGAAFSLKDACDVTLFEKDARVGGHAHTVSIDYDGARMDVDTGFIVYNVRNYPNLVGLLEALGVESVDTDMSFSFASPDLEWSSTFPRGVFAQKRNLVSPRFLTLLADIARFNRQALADLEGGRLSELTLGGYLRQRRFSEVFERCYLLPMGAAIWSTGEAGIAQVPAESFVRFFSNHNLLQMAQPCWRTIRGGSQAYVLPLTKALGERVRAGAAVTGVRRLAGGVQVATERGQMERFDQVILACHSDQALGLLADAEAEERAFLGAVRYAANRVYLHRDKRLMPSRRAAWGSWNYLIGPNGRPGGVTYWMNSLQGLDPSRPVFVSLNPAEPPDPALTFGAYDYDHPQFDAASLAAQRQFNRIQGRGGVWYAGAWLGHGFHEDGLTAGLRAAQALGGSVPWTFVDHRIPGGALVAPQPAKTRRLARA